MSNGKWALWGGAAALIVVGVVIAIGLASTGDRVSDESPVPGDEHASRATTAAQTTGDTAATTRPDDTASDDPDAEVLPRGPELPDLSGADLATGRPVSLRAASDGRPMVIQLWASWCHVCDEGASDVRRFVEERPDVQLIGVDVQDDPDSGRTFVSSHGWTHQSIYDEGEIAATFGLRGTPTFIFVHADGTIAGQTVGDPSYEGLIRIADRLVASS